MYKKYQLMVYFCFMLISTSFICAEASNDWQTILSSSKGSYNNTSYQLVLYINPNCPYCQKVTNYLKSQGREIPIKNTQDPAIRAELVQIGGKSQVPCLVINGKALYESNDIINWLNAHP